MKRRLFFFVTSLATPRGLLDLPNSADFFADFLALFSVNDVVGVAVADGFCRDDEGRAPPEILPLGVGGASASACVFDCSTSSNLGRMLDVVAAAPPNPAPSLCMSSAGRATPRHQSAAFVVGAA